ncbi:MAG: lasso peptide biosynthesis B2 protein [Chloroflexi bacterium]|nr:lasso peptide biosynthesis B2 protein [Chloroflexota bacterium]
MSVFTRLRNLSLVPSALPALLFDSRYRRLFAEMRDFAQRLPQALSNRSLPDCLAALTPPTSDLRLPTSSIRRLADLTALLDRRSPLGLCLRRSLVRYHFLRRAGLLVAIEFGARFKDGRPDREVAGHAWLTLDGQPYFEEGENYQGFTVMIQFPRLTTGDS